VDSQQIFAPRSVQSRSAEDPQNCMVSSARRGTHTQQTT